MSDKRRELYSKSAFFKELNELYKKNTLLKYIGTTDIQVNWGQNDDPRLVLQEGKIYEIEEIDIHRSHTKIMLVGINGRFNSASFEVVDIKLN